MLVVSTSTCTLGSTVYYTYSVIGINYYGGVGNLQMLQDKYHDLVPKHKTDGEDILKYFQRGGRCHYLFSDTDVA